MYADSKLYKNISTSKSIKMLANSKIGKSIQSNSLYKSYTSENVTVIFCRILAFCIFQTIFACILFKYAFKNPDTDNCWVTPDREKPSKMKQGTEGEMNMADHFHYWFLAGFITCCVSILAAFVEIVMRKRF